MLIWTHMSINIFKSANWKSCFVISEMKVIIWIGLGECRRRSELSWLRVSGYVSTRMLIEEPRSPNYRSLYLSVYGHSESTGTWGDPIFLIVITVNDLLDICEVINRIELQRLWYHYSSSNYYSWLVFVYSFCYHQRLTSLSPGLVESWLDWQLVLLDCISWYSDLGAWEDSGHRHYHW